MLVPDCGVFVGFFTVSGNRLLSFHVSHRTLYFTAGRVPPLNSVFPCFLPHRFVLYA